MSISINILIIATTFSAVILSASACAQTTKTKKMPKHELDKLMTTALPFAQKMLSEYGEFFPYGGAVTAKGEIVDVGATDGNEHPPSQKLIDMIIESFQAKAKAGQYRATAIVFDVRVTDPATAQKSDAIQINLDHAEGMSVSVFLPYECRGEGNVIYGKMFAQKGDAKIFKQASTGH